MLIVQDNMIKMKIKNKEHYILIMLICVYSFMSCSSSGNYTQCENYENLKIIKGELSKEGEPFTGCVEVYEGNEVVFKFLVKDGYMEGEFEEFENGKLLRKGNHLRNQLFGELVTYYPNGSVYKRQICDSNGLINGVSLEYFENGNIRSETTYNHGKKDGVFKNYHKNGQLSDRGRYQNDMVSDTLFGYFDNGSLRSISFLEQGLENGISINFLDRSQNTFFWGRMNHGISIDRWYYKLEVDSCFYRDYKSNDTYSNIKCDCSELPFPSW